MEDSLLKSLFSLYKWMKQYNFVSQYLVIILSFILSNNNPQCQVKLKSTLQNYLLTVFSNKVVIVPIKWKSVLVSIYIWKRFRFCYSQFKVFPSSKDASFHFLDCRIFYLQFSQPAVTCSKFTIETLEQGVKYVHSKQ